MSIGDQKKSFMIRYVCISIIAILFAGGAASGQQIIVLQGLDVKPYNEALKRFSSVIDGKSRRLLISGM